MVSANKSDPPAFAWIVLAGLGIWDFIRGFSHTYFSSYFAESFAGLDLSHNGADLLMLMGSFGISNFLTGAIFLVVAFKARPVVPWILGLIPLTYAFGLLGIRLHATPEAAFPGRYMMLVYLAICVVTFVACIISMRRARRAIR
jgi:hypothetical protein